MWLRSRRLLCCALVVLCGCNSVKPKAPTKANGTVRYRLLLRENPVSPQDAVHCYGGCQSAATPQDYVECLAQCPGFEMTPDEYCSNTDVPPVAACLTVRQIPAKSEPPPGMVVIAIIGSIALVAASVSLCNISSSQCGMAVPPR